MKRLAVFITFGLILAFSVLCAARTVRETNYRYDQIWSTAVRFLRVDSGFAIIEQDKGTGYVLFEYRDSGRALNGSMELIPQERDGFELITMGIRIQNMPSYVENILMDKLVRKLKDEYGEPPAARRIETETEQADARKNRSSKDTKTDDRNDDEDDKESIDDNDER
jgi:hypothetical protein